MGTEIVFVLIIPIALVCLIFAFARWLHVAKLLNSNRSGVIAAYFPLIIGFAVSMAGLGLLTYISRNAEFTVLIQQGYYTEDERSLYLPSRVFGQVIVNLVFVLPAICLVVIPLTVRLIKTRRLTLQRIGLFAVAGWVLSSLAGWLLFSHPYSLLSFLGSTAAPIFIYALPIPTAAFLFFGRKMEV